MSADPQMTWNWKWKVTATGATALAGWLASEPIQPSGTTDRASTAVSRGATTAAQNARNAVTVSDIERQASRLAAAAPLAEAAGGPLPEVTGAAEAPPARNLFRFQPRQSRPAARRVTAPIDPAPLAPAAPTPFPLRLTGIATDVVNGVPQRTAVVRSPFGLELAKEGEIAAPGYRVVTVGESSIEVERVSDGVRQQLLLTP
jgi:hypothetical protein